MEMGAADRAGRLVQQAGRLAEKDVLRILADLGDLDLGELFKVAAVILAAEDGAEADLERRRGRQTRAAQHLAGGVGVETAEFAAALREPGRNAAE